MRTVRIVTFWICNSLLVWPVHKAGCPPFPPIPSLFIQNVIIIWWKPFPLKAKNQPRKVKIHIHSFIYINTFFLSLSLSHIHSLFLSFMYTCMKAQHDVGLTLRFVTENISLQLLQSSTSSSCCHRTSVSACRIFSSWICYQAKQTGHADEI